MVKPTPIQQGLPRPEVRSDEDAVLLTNAALDALEALEPIMEEETELLKQGETRRAIDLTPIKEEAAKRYMTAIEVVKANAIALQRFRPDAIDMLRDRHEAFQSILALNMAVLTTARSVSEGLIREVSADVAKAMNTQGYGPQTSSTQKRQASAPLALSKEV